MAWPGDHRPRVSRGIATSRALGRENANFSTFQILLKISLERGRTCLQRIRKGSQRQRGDDLPQDESRAEVENNSLFCCQDDLILFFFNRLRVTHASFFFFQQLTSRGFIDFSQMRLGDIIRGRESQRYRTHIHKVQKY